MLFYIKEHLQCNQIQWSCDNVLECVGLNVVLSPQMSYTIIGIYRPHRPPSAKTVFFEHLKALLKECKFDK